ncbi:MULTISPECIES: 2-amino-4-hydroxy-6-hydroxymethyldihydropteridine diphosphokinase [Brevibacterium]|uniref:Bifunctional folate synthesis protein n=1 Tax=Brevibacterium salitolerans TaxID=1403566 RepID=A0ABN2WV08_9MICO|nr:2-amino-4-hydroxy-6-hydroxymethyldihydropteridine diphosphokinase [Brevibacterium sp.]
MSDDVITLTGLTARGRHGVFEFEKREGQDFRVDVELHGDLSAPAASDDLADTADYGALADALVEIVTGEPYDLIEALAGALVDRCLEFAPEARVTVHKPQAPIAHEFADVSVSLHRRRGMRAGAAASGSRETTAEGVAPAGPAPDGGPARSASGTSGHVYEAVVALGANLGDACAALQDAAHALSLHPRIDLRAGSSVYVTAPVGGVEQPDFHNAAVVVRTALPPRELLSVCQGIEAAAGRTREIRWGPRTLDLDLISARTLPASGAAEEPVTWRDEVLVLPHPLAGERAFVLAPWAELQPDAVVETPAGVRTVAEACAAAPDAAGIRRTGESVLASARPFTEQAET